VVYLCLSHMSAWTGLAQGFDQSPRKPRTHDTHPVLSGLDSE